MPLPLLVAHAPALARDWHALCWRIDARMGGIVLGAREGAVAAIRLAWWEEALTDCSGKCGGEPLLDAWRATSPTDDDRAAVADIAEGWRMLLDPEAMTAADWGGFGRRRGALFRLIARAALPAEGAQAGAMWALWDVARVDANRERAAGAFAAAIAQAQAMRSSDLRALPRALRLCAGMALDDVRAGRAPRPDFTVTQYVRLLRRALIG